MLTKMWKCVLVVALLIMCGCSSSTTDTSNSNEPTNQNVTVIDEEEKEIILSLLSITNFSELEDTFVFNYTKNDITWGLFITEDYSIICYMDDSLSLPLDGFLGYDVFKEDARFFINFIAGEYYIFLDQEDYNLAYSKDLETFYVFDSENDYEISDDFLSMTDYWNLDYVLSEDEKQVQNELSMIGLTYEDLTKIKYADLKNIDINQLQEASGDKEDENTPLTVQHSKYYDDFYVLGEKQKDSRDKRGLEIIDLDDDPVFNLIQQFADALSEGKMSDALSYCCEDTELYQKIQRLSSPDFYEEYAGTIIDNDKALQKQLSELTSFKKFVNGLMEMYYLNGLSLYVATIIDENHREYQVNFTYVKDDSLKNMYDINYNDYRNDLLTTYPEFENEENLNNSNDAKYAVFEQFGDQILNNIKESYIHSVVQRSNLFIVDMELIDGEWKIATFNELDRLINQTVSAKKPEELTIVENNEYSLLASIMNQAWSYAWEFGVELYSFNKEREKALSYITYDVMHNILKNTIYVKKIEEGLFSSDYHYKRTLDKTDYLYYGEVNSDSEPDGYGMLLEDYDGGYILSYVGNFEDGKSKGYGISCDIFESVASGTSWAFAMIPVYDDEEYIYVAHRFREGYFENNTLSGIGNTYIIATNDNGKTCHFSYTVGEYKDGIVNGRAKEYEKGILKFEGIEKDGEYSEGTEYYENSTVKYSGQYSNGQYDGEGVLYDVNGNIIHSGTFDYGDIK